MKVLYAECQMGAAGDMLMGALYELLSTEEQEDFLKQMKALQLPGITLSAHPGEKMGIHGTKMEVAVYGREEEEEASPRHDHDHHHHSSYKDMLHQISHLELPAEVKQHASSVYRLIGEAEAKVHNTDLEQIHFHEVGTLDALADVVGCCLLLHRIQPEQILCSPIHVGSGTVHCAHGILPVPAPATAELLKGVPIYSGEIKGELCTPTGAALLKYFAESFCSLPSMEVEKIGYGLGTKDFPQANAVRLFLGKGKDDEHKETILELSCNLDDMTGEAIGFATEQLLLAGALDVCATAVTMKKGRPGVLLTCLCRTQQEDAFTKMIFTHTTTRGIRVKECRRHTLEAEFQIVSTPYGDIRVKINSGYGLTRRKPEYEDVAKAALAHGTDMQTVSQAALLMVVPCHIPQPFITAVAPDH